MRGFSRGGMVACSVAAMSASAFSCWSGGSGLIFSFTISWVWTTPNMTSRCMTPPSTLQLDTRGSFLNQTGCAVPPHGTAMAPSC